MFRLHRLSLLPFAALALNNLHPLIANAQDNDDPVPLCQTSTGVPGRLYRGITAAIVPPDGAVWAFDRDGSILDGTAKVWGSNVNLGFGVRVTAYIVGTSYIAFSAVRDGGEIYKNISESCRVEVVEFDPKLHDLASVRAGNCTLTGDVVRPFQVGETRILRRQDQLGAMHHSGDLVEVEFIGDRYVQIRALAKGIVNLSVASENTGPPFSHSYTGFCTIVVE